MKLTVVLDCYEAMDTYSRIELPSMFQKFVKYGVFPNSTPELITLTSSSSVKTKVKTLFENSRHLEFNTTVSFHSFVVVQYDCKFP